MKFKGTISDIGEQLISTPRAKQLLRKSNWRKLSNLEKRQAILLDIIKNVLTRVVLPKSIYMDEDLSNAQPDQNPAHTSLQDILPNYENCEVCERGAMLLSCIKYNNNVSAHEYGSLTMVATEAKAGVDNYFSLSERISMESIFEQKMYTADNPRLRTYGEVALVRENVMIAISLATLKTDHFTKSVFKQYISPQSIFDESDMVYEVKL